jgi:enamine deaminase RidA (YjgF/YER057c/UK114 family)
VTRRRNVPPRTQDEKRARPYISVKCRTADMTLANIVRLNVYTADVDEYLTHFVRVNDRFASSRYATTVLGVARLPAPQLLVMLEATAVD